MAKGMAQELILGLVATGMWANGKMTDCMGEERTPGPTATNTQANLRIAERQVAGCMKLPAAKYGVTRIQGASGFLESDKAVIDNTARNLLDASLCQGA